MAQLIPTPEEVWTFTPEGIPVNVIPPLDPDGESARLHMLIVRLDRARRIGDRLAIANIESLLGIRAADRVTA